LRRTVEGSYRLVTRRLDTTLLTVVSARHLGNRPAEPLVTRELSSHDEPVSGEPMGVFRPAIAVLALGILVTTVTPAAAQYFGRNKVRYEDFDFRVLQTPHFDIYYYPSEEAAVAHAARMAERWYTRLSRELGHELSERQPIVFYASHAHFRQTTVVPGILSEGVGGVTEHRRGRVVMPFAVGLGETDHVLGHELVHAFQRDILRDRGSALATLPLWFLEGMAEHLSVGHLDANTLMWLRDALNDDQLPQIGDLQDPRWFPYRYGQALWSFLTERFGDRIVPQALASRATGGAIGRIVAVTGVEESTLSAEWHSWIRTVAGEPPATIDRREPLLAKSAGGGRLNVAPALSPDGKQVLFLSERDEYSVDVYLADAKTGAITRRLIQTAADPHFDSLQFIGSSGAWDPAGKRVILATVSRGQPMLTIMQVETGHVERELVLEELDEVHNPAWSPDGRRVVFSAMRGGLSDLYVIELETSRVEALTTDSYTDLQPSWSPDGRTIAFATDRFNSSIDALTFGRPQLALIDVESRNVRQLPSLPHAKHIDPQWSADGLSLYFVADPLSRSNVFRLDVRTGRLFQVTQVDGGVSGVTAVSPALSVAGDASVLAYSLYRHGAYELHVVESRDGTPLEPVALGTTTRAPDPAGTPALGLLDSQSFTVTPYRRGLSLDSIGQPYLSAGGGSFGAFFRAGVSFSFADMLGQHALRTAVQVGKNVHEFGVQATYVNRQSRWNWAIGGEQLPMVLGASRMTPAAGAAGIAMADEQVIFRQIHRRFTGAAIYPFSSARRVEVTGALHRISSLEETTSTLYSRTGSMIGEPVESRTNGPAATLVETGLALVHDSALLGPLSPLLGERFRFEVSPTLGNLSFATVLADYRRYLMPVRPFTVAFRLKYLGRHGVDDNETRLIPLALSLRDAVRGDSARTLATEICGARGSATCYARQYLGTQQLATANVEWRFPIPGAFRGTPSYGPLPVEGFVFSDTGAFRTAAVALDGNALWRMRSSAGAGVRLNAAGFVFEVATARRVLGPSRGWTMVVNFQPGF
jgi:hypothetical protein